MLRGPANAARGPRPLRGRPARGSAEPPRRQVRAAERGGGTKRKPEPRGMVLEPCFGVRRGFAVAEPCVGVRV